MAEWPFSAAIRTVRGGLSARAGLTAYRAAGGAIADSTWYRMVAEARNTVADRAAELDRPLNRRPTATEATIWSTKKRSGWLQQVEIMARDRTTNEVITIPYSITGTRPLTREQAIQKALDTYTPEGTDGDKQQVLGVQYAFTLLMQPGGG